MSKTFKSAYAEHGDQKLNIIGVDDGVRVSADHGSHGAKGIIIAPSDAPALALAILEAAGVEPVNHTVRGLGNPNWLEGIAHSLQLHIEHEAELTAAAKAEAEEMAKLEAEALELFNARQEAINFFDWEPYKDFANEDSKQTWLAVARRARELNKEENNA